MSSKTQYSSLHSTPLNPKKHTNYDFRAALLANDARRSKVEQEMRESFIGPMPVEIFFHDFMDVDFTSVTCPTADFSKVANSVRDEKAMYAPLINAIHDAKLCPGLTLVHSGDSPDREGERLKPDISLYLSDIAETLQTKKSRKTVWRAMQMHIEVKGDNAPDPFDDDDPETFERAADDARKSRGQIALYAGAQLARQHRLWIFSVMILGTRARFLRWDRAGVTVTKAFSYVDNPEVLAEFFWRFGRLDEVGRGHDPSVELASDEEQERFTDAVKAAAADGTFPRAEVALDPDFPRYKVTVDDRTRGKRSLIVARPFFFSRSTTGRCTKGYVALDLEEDRLVFLKDSWRPDKFEIPSERDTYLRLQEKGAPFVADFLCGDDVPDPYDLSQPPEDELDSGSHPINSDSSLTPLNSSDEIAPSEADEGSEYLPSSSPPSSAKLPPRPAHAPPSPTPTENLKSNARPGAQKILTQKYNGKFGSRYSPVVRPYIHFRMVQGSLYLPLKDFKNSKHLVQVIYDAIQAIDFAWKNVKVFHRDISGNNIMINGERGVLNDWDLSRFIMAGPARQHDRTGTWQFISTLLLKYPTKPHTISDDLESAFFVLMYYALHYVQHNKKKSEIDMDLIFDEDSVKDVDGRTYSVGGRGKTSMLTEEEWVAGLEFRSEPLTDLFWDLHGLFGYFVSYHVMPEKRRKKAITSAHHDALAKLSDCDEVLRLFRKALDRTDWPTDDKAPSDQFPPTGIQTLTFKVPLPASGVSSYLGSGATRSSAKRRHDVLDENVNVPLIREGPARDLGYVEPFEWEDSEEEEHPRKKTRTLSSH